MNVKTIAALSAVIVLTAASPHAARSQPGDPVVAKLIGTWKLVSVVREEVPSGVKTDLMGPNPVGFISYGPEGRMMVLIARSARKKPAGAVPTPDEAQALTRSMVSYTGTYAVGGGKVTHTVDISWNESWTGTKQIRNYKFDGDRLSLSTDVTPDPIDGKVSVRSLIWEKLK